jgi:hypothetical protein
MADETIRRVTAIALRTSESKAKAEREIAMELESVLLACGFNEADAKIIVGEFLSGIGNVGEARGVADQKSRRVSDGRAGG